MNLQNIITETVRVARNSPCASRRGATIFVEDTYGILTQGWNHQPHPFKCSQDQMCRRACYKTAIHAEQHALTGLAYRGNIEHTALLHAKLSAYDDVPAASEQPRCLECSKLILVSGISAVYLLHDQQFANHPSATVVEAEAFGETLAGRAGRLKVVRYPADLFHWITCACTHRIDLAPRVSESRRLHDLCSAK